MARKKVRYVPPETDRMVTLFLSLMILLLAFFIVLVSMSRIEEKKKVDVLESIKSTFGFLPGGSSPFPSLGGIVSKASDPVSKLEQDFIKIKQLTFDTLGQDKVQLLTDGGRRVVVLDSEDLFDPEGVELKPEAGPFLKGLAAIVAPSPYWIEVGGHTDDIDPGPLSPARNNWQLSGLRALAVVKFLAAAGVANRRLEAIGYGPLAPLKPNDSAENRRANHRIEIVLDQSLAEEAEGLRLIRPGSLLYRGFSFDLFGKPEEQPAERGRAD